MKIKSAISIVLLIVNFTLIIFLAANRIIIGRNLYMGDEIFLGMKFDNYRYSISRLSVYMPHFFALVFLVSLFLKSNLIVKYVLLIGSIIGFLLAWKAYDYFAPY